MDEESFYNSSKVNCIMYIFFLDCMKVWYKICYITKDLNF